MAFSPDGSRIVTGGADHAVKLWDTLGGSELLALSEHRGFVSGVAFTADGRKLVSTGHDRQLVVRDAVDWRVPIHESNRARMAGLTAWLTEAIGETAGVAE